MRSLGIYVITGAGLLAMAATAQAPASFRAVGNMSQLMIDIIYPTSDAIFYADRDPPKNQKDWNLLRAQALMLAESGNLLIIEGRARDQDNWVKDSRMMIDVGEAAFKAAQAKDMNAILALNEPLEAACVTCHTQYRPNYHRKRPAVEAK